MTNINAKRRKRKSNKKIIMIMSVIVIILIAVLIVIGTKKHNKEAEKVDPVVNEEVENTEVENKEESAELYSEDVKAFKIETPYCDLLYPEKWKNIVETEIVSVDGVEEVQFWAKLEGKDKVHLFDIIFGGESNEVGTLEIEDGEAVTVNVVSYEFEEDDSWTEDEKEIIYSLLEDINYILLQLEELDEYTSMY